jgi:FlaA1/EpsC-like NDP-sugar epimerase
LRESAGRPKAKASSRALIVGAGDAGEMLARAIARNGDLDYEAVGFVDDDRRKRGARIHGIEVLGVIDDLPRLCRTREVDEVLLAIPSATAADRQRVLERCRETGLAFKTVPQLEDLLQGRASIGHLQEVRPEDVLGRPAIRLNHEQVRRDLEGKRILVTGAAGSIGSELCRQIAAFHPEALLLFDRAESGLYFLDLELKSSINGNGGAAIPIVGDILDQRRIEEVVREYRPDLIYHAAAYKHVPLMEEHPLEAIANNVFGTETVALAAKQAGVEKLVLVSTDKAVRPVGTMGMTKRLAECVIRATNGCGTTFVAVRFGNVLGSDGSVLPLFQWQIARGGPVTVTDPEATRYFMLISEAAQLVLQAGAIGTGGEVFFLDMGESVRIMDLARNVVRMAGLKPGKDIQIQVTGLRPGERLNELLVTDGQELFPTEHEKVLAVHELPFEPDKFHLELGELKELVANRDGKGAIECLKTMAARY